MNKTLLVLGIAGAFIIILALIFTWAWIYSPITDRGRFGDHRGTMGDIDRHFIEQMVSHHENAVAMANIALAKAEHPEIKQLAGSISRDQTREISQMREWYKKWYGTDIPVSSGMMSNGTGMDSTMMGNSTDLEELENAKPFDKEFIEQMTLHHKMEIMTAQMALNNSDHPEIRSLAESVIKTQSVEIEEMGKWYRNWYSRWRKLL